MPGTMEFLASLARECGGKVADHAVAQECGVSPRTVRAWRYGELPAPLRIERDLHRLRAERAERLIAEGRRELAEISAETRQ